jgi:hypothetical protein
VLPDLARPTAEVEDGPRTAHQRRGLVKDGAVDRELLEVVTEGGGVVLGHGGVGPLHRSGVEGIHPIEFGGSMAGRPATFSGDRRLFARRPRYAAACVGPV